MATLPPYLPTSTVEIPVRDSHVAHIEPFCQILACFGCPVPVDLFIRAARPKKIWRSDGGFDIATPFERIVIPSWLEKVQGLKDTQENDDEEWLQSVRADGIKIIMQSGVQCLQLSKDVLERFSQSISTEKRREQLSTCVAITVHAFPCRFAEISGEELAFQFLPFLQSSILPLLAALTDEDISKWLIPCRYNSPERYQH